MSIKILLKTLAAIRDGLQRRHTDMRHPYIARIRERVTGRLRGASVALIGSGALLIALGFGLRDLRRRIEHTPSLAD
jgi:hypothetical protein